MELGLLEQLLLGAKGQGALPKPEGRVELPLTWGQPWIQESCPAWAKHRTQLDLRTNSLSSWS